MDDLHSLLHVCAGVRVCIRVYVHVCVHPHVASTAEGRETSPVAGETWTPQEVQEGAFLRSMEIS